MISLLSGTIHSLSSESFVLLTAGGVGYEIVPAGQLLTQLKEGEQISVITYLQVKEDSLTLFGFADMADKSLFQDLISVSGIGAKSALGLLTFPAQELKNAVENADVAFISRAKGIGKKTAQRLCVELAGKLGDMETSPKKRLVTTEMADAIDALIGLGYKKSDVESLMKDADQTLSSEELIRYYLGNA